jgi:predicted small integral membrane protein
MVVAGEWFAMWQSAAWNGQEAAFRFYVAVLGVLIFVSLPDADLPRAAPGTSAIKRRH